MVGEMVVGVAFVSEALALRRCSAAKTAGGMRPNELWGRTWL